LIDDGAEIEKLCQMAEHLADRLGGDDFAAVHLAAQKKRVDQRS